MIHELSWKAVIFFSIFVGFTLGLSFWLGRKAKSSEGFFAAHGQIPWFVNGIAFAGDYLSAASFLGICGMIAFYGYDGFLYSIGYLAGWIVALFVIAEPMKRLGRFTFADALDSKFNSPGIKLAAGISTLAVSIFYLIPQMVGAGVLVQPLLALASLGGRRSGWYDRHIDRSHGRNGFDDVGAVSERHAAGFLQRDPDMDDSAKRVQSRRRRHRRLQISNVDCDG
jgi:cation/acetate symporter